MPSRSPAGGGFRKNRAGLASPLEKGWPSRGQTFCWVCRPTMSRTMTMRGEGRHERGKPWPAHAKRNGAYFSLLIWV